MKLFVEVYTIELVTASLWETGFSSWWIAIGKSGMDQSPLSRSILIVNSFATEKVTLFRMKLKKMTLQKTRLESHLIYKNRKKIPWKSALFDQSPNQFKTQRLNRAGEVAALSFSPSADGFIVKTTCKFFITYLTKNWGIKKQSQTRMLLILYLMGEPFIEFIRCIKHETLALGTLFTLSHQSCELITFK